MKQPLIVANWKCNPTTLAEAQKLLKTIEKGVKNIKKVEVVICPPFVYLSGFRFRASGFRLGAQDCFWEEKGAFTGEISAKMLKGLGCKYVIIGHSERKGHLKETNEMIAKKMKAAIAAGLKPIFCIGETQKEKREGQGLRTLNSQISKGLKDIKEKEARNIIIAYEPVWAIGTGKPCEVDTTLTKSLIIRQVLKKRYSLSLSRKTRILYGGSVTSQNALKYIRGAKMNGLLVGGASLKAQEFSKIVKEVSKS
ncbi:hypothetical protein AMJ50_02180 [Parcubacteria bacterium DG_74_3]|nr:MAG: hypothetical protein AMJ50_02180 [Parcubacteria bacterium DG_74_3]